MKREHKPLEMIHAEWHDVKKEDKETRVKWLIKHQKMMLPYDINWEKLIECNRTGKWPIIAKPKPIKLPKRHEKLYEEIMACLLYTSPSPRDKRQSRMPSSA